MSNDVRWIKPQQARSQRTLERVAEATEMLLRKKRFDQVTIQEIASRAESSIGAFYARFKDKQALYDWLVERHTEDLAATCADATRPDRWNGVGLAPRVRAVFTLSLQFMRNEPGLARAMIVSRFSQDQTNLHPGQTSQKKSLSVWKEFILACRSEMNHAEPDYAVHVAMLAAQSVVQIHALFPNTNYSPELRSRTDEQIVDDVTRMFLAFVGASTPARSTDPESAE